MCASYQWEQEVVEFPGPVPSFGFGDAVVILSRQPTGEGGVGSTETWVLSKSKQETPMFGNTTWETPREVYTSFAIEGLKFLGVLRKDFLWI